jgi:hypothetical protein
MSDLRLLVWFLVPVVAVLLLKPLGPGLRMRAIQRMGHMRTWWIFGFEWWGCMRPAQMTTKGTRYTPLFLGLWLRRGG